MKIQVAILGASGYGAGELLRLLTQHPHARVAALTSTSQVGAEVGAVHPHLRGFYPGLRIAEAVDLAALLDGDAALVISALPHGASSAALDKLLTSAASQQNADRLRVIDLSGDLRLKDVDVHQQHYAESPLLPQRRAEFVYGLPELRADGPAAGRGSGADGRLAPALRAGFGQARCVANPGCLATAAILAAAPLIDAEFSGPVVVDAKTGSSGSGKQLKETTHHPTRHADYRAYKPLAHQHEPEILQAWGDPRGQRVQLSFVPQSLPVARGIFATAYLTLAHGAAPDASALRERYAAYYAGSPFIRLVDDTPTLQDVVGSNFCDIAVHVRGRQAVAMAALDNLVKGMAGAAIQNMNLMCGLDETIGLWTPSLRPV